MTGVLVCVRAHVRCSKRKEIVENLTFPSVR